MISQDRYNRLDLELRQAQARIRELEESVELARRVALRNICAMCLNEIVEVPVIGEAR